MPRGKPRSEGTSTTGANHGFEEKLWQAADKLRGQMDPAEYKHVVLGLVFLKYISHAFEEYRPQLLDIAQDPASDLYVADEAEQYADAAGFCKSATSAAIASHGYVLTLGRYVGAAETEEDDEPFEEKMARLVATLEAHFRESERREATIRAKLRSVGLYAEGEP